MHDCISSMSFSVQCAVATTFPPPFRTHLPYLSFNVWLVGFFRWNIAQNRPTQHTCVRGPYLFTLVILIRTLNHLFWCKLLGNRTSNKCIQPAGGLNCVPGNMLETIYSNMFYVPEWKNWRSCFTRHETVIMTAHFVLLNFLQYVTEAQTIFAAEYIDFR